jgi:DNA-binding CsgD family transcriptional regulator
MPGTLSFEDSRLLMRITQRLCRPRPAAGLLADQGLAADLTRLFCADFLGSTRWNPTLRAFEDAYCVGRGPEMARQYQEHFQFEDPISPKARLRRGPCLVHSIMPRKELVRTRYYADFLRPFKTVDGIDLYLYQGSRNVGDLRIWRAPGHAPMGVREAALLELLQPYLLNALLGSSELGEQVGVDTASVERCPWPCFTHARGASVQPANAPAERLWSSLTESEALSLRGRIAHVACTGRPSAWQEFTLCMARAGDGAAAIVQFAPLFPPAGAAGHLEQAFGLTPREAQVCQQLAAGRTDDQIAAALGLSYWTVRTHLRKVFLKFDVANRVDLARVLGTLCARP